MSTLEPLSLLLVDDNKNNLFTLHTLLDEHIKANIYEADSGQLALRTLSAKKVDLIILDVQMPEMDGFEFAELIRARKSTRHIPIVFLTAAYKADEFKEKGLSIGAADYLTKPIDTVQLITRVRTYLRFLEQERKYTQGLEQLVQERTSELLNSNDSLKQEINEREQAQEELRRMHKELEWRVEERTQELSLSNQRLEQEIRKQQEAEAALQQAKEEKA